MGDKKMKKYIEQQLELSIQINKDIINDEQRLNKIKECIEAIVLSLKKGGKVLIAGNGGSAADAQHIAAELVSRFNFDRPALPAIALTTDTSILTAIGNDYGFEKVFSRQIEANGKKGDVFIAISTSGNSKNILDALAACKAKGIISIGLTCQSGGKMESLCDHCIKVPSPETPRIQEAHILISHIICAVVEDEIFGKEHKR